jgi:hypothetical protein
MEWLPPARVETLRVATPFVTVPVPSAPLTLSVNVTLPVAVDGDIVAVSVVVLPNVMLLGFAPSATVGVTWLIVSVIAELADAA